MLIKYSIAQPWYYNRTNANVINHNNNEVDTTFKSNLKETEWTQNPIYKNAKNADVQLTFNPKEKRNNNMPNFQRANIDSYLLEIGPYLSVFNNYANDCVSKKAKMADEVEQKKN